MDPTDTSITRTSPPASARMRLLVRLLRTALALIGAVALVVTVTPVVFWWASALAGPWTDARGDTLIILGGSVLDDGMLGASSYWRSVYGVTTYREGTFRTVVLSGGGRPGKPVAETMRDFLVCHGVPREAIRVEVESQTTRENAVFTQQMLAGTPGTKILMTSDYHMLRAYRAFRKAGLDVIPRPFPDARKRASSFEGRWGAFLDVSRETVALAYYFARGWI